jgi:hypothetical protein
MARTRSGIVLVALLWAGSACTFTHRCTVPTPVVEAAPGARLPLAVELRYAPGSVPAEVKDAAGWSGPTSDHVMIVDADAPTRALFDRLAASMFERTVPPPPADLVLEIRLDRFRVGVVPFGPFTGEVGYHAALRTPEGAEVAAFDVAGAASVAGSLRQPLFCKGRGEAVALALQEAGAGAVRAMAESPQLAAWLAGRGVEKPAFTVRAIDAYPTETAKPDETAIATASATPTPPATPTPVRAGPPPAPVQPRSFSVRGGLAAFRPETSAGKLEHPSGGLGVAYLGFGTRLLEWLSLDLPLEYVTRSYAATSVPHLTGFGPRVTLDSTSFGAGLRVTPPVGARPLLEPWLGAGARVVYTKLTVTYFGGLSGGEPTDTAWSAGADVGGGLNLYPGGPWVLGFEARRIFGRASLAPLGAVGIGGVVIGGSFGAAFPP